MPTFLEPVISTKGGKRVPNLTAGGQIKLLAECADTAYCYLHRHLFVGIVVYQDV